MIMEFDNTRDALEVMLHMAETEIRCFLEVLSKKGDASWTDQFCKVRIILCQDWLARYAKLDAALEVEHSSQ